MKVFGTVHQSSEHAYQYNKVVHGGMGHTNGAEPEMTVKGMSIMEMLPSD